MHNRSVWIPEAPHSTPKNTASSRIVSDMGDWQIRVGLRTGNLGNKWNLWCK